MSKFSQGEPVKEERCVKSSLGAINDGCSEQLLLQLKLENAKPINNSLSIILGNLDFMPFNDGMTY